MSGRSAEGIIKEFGMSNLLIESNLKKLQKSKGINLNKNNKGTIKKDGIFEQFQIKIRHQARKMAEYYEVFYCLENSIRDLITDVLSEHEGKSWWKKSVPQQIQQEVKKRIQREKSEGVTNRSESELDYTNFGELAEIIVKNWKHFDDILSNRTAVQRVISRLNTLRGPIAHCCTLPEDEVERLKLSMKDWFRLMS